MPHAEWLQSLVDMVSKFPESQLPSQQLLADIQVALDEAIFIAINHGAQLPHFMTEARQLDAMHERIGPIRIAELASQPVPHQTVEALVSIITKLYREFDALNRRAAQADHR